jgi:ABC-type amino acid transport system permease subunit
MNIVQAVGLFLGIIAGAVLGAVLGSGHGTIAYVAAAVGGGFVGVIVGTLFGHLCCIGYSFARATARVYWEVLTGRRKLPVTSTKSERRHLLTFIGFVFLVSMAVLGGIYLFGSEAQRSRLLWVAVAICGTCIIGLVLLSAHHRHMPPREAHEKER